MDKFYEGEDENEPGNNNSSDNKSNCEVSVFLYSEDSCDE